MSNKLKILDLTFKYYEETQPIFSGINYDFISGDIVGIYGYNGSGKTTLLNCLSGYYKPKSGSVLLNNLSPDRCRKEIAIINAAMDLFEYMTLEDNIKFFLEFYSKRSDKKEIMQFLDKYEIFDHKDKYVFEASNGMLKKTQIIIALLLKPKLLLADEPLNSLDEKSQVQFFKDIEKLKRENHSISVFSLHNKELVKEHCNQIIYLE